MKRRLLFALMAILAVSLLFVGCPSGEPDPAGKPTGPSTPGGQEPGEQIPDDEGDEPEENEAETPMIDEAASQLKDADYKVGVKAESLVVVPVSTPNSASYTYEWWEADSADANWTAVGFLESGDTFTPPTDAEGTFYYYCIVEYEGVKTPSRIVTITVEL